MKVKIHWDGPRIRLLLAVGLCAIMFMATTTPESNDDFCSRHDQGELLVTNNSSSDIWLEWKGEAGAGVKGGGFIVHANSSHVEDGLGTGYYTYLLFESTEIKLGPADYETKHSLKKTGTFAIIAQSAVEIVYP